MPSPAVALPAAIVTSSVMGSRAARSAAGTQAASAQAATDAQERMFERQVELQEPFREAGLAGQNRLMQLLGLGEDKTAKDFGRYATADFTPANFLANQDPGYAFRVSEGMKALDRTAAARGGLISGSALRGATRYGQEMGSQEYQNAFNRFQAERAGTLNPFQALAGTAQSGANVLGQQAGQYGANVSNILGSYGSAAQGNIIGAGNAQASGYMGAANAIGGGVGQGINFYQNQQLLNRLPTYGTSTLGGGF